MVVGLRIFNDDGISQISSQQRNLTLIGKGTFNSGNPNVYAYPVNFTHDGPVIFAAAAPSGASCVVTKKTGTNYEFDVLVGYGAEDATWYAFSYPKNIQSTMGLRVFNADGALTYDSQQKPLRMVYFSSIWVPGTTPPFPSKLKDVPEFNNTWLPNSDIYIPQQRANRTYASVGIHMIGYRKPSRIKWGSGWLLGWAFFYWLPITYANGVYLQCRRLVFSPTSTQWPGGTYPYGGLSLYPNGANYQTSWIIDVTDY